MSLKNLIAIVLLSLAFDVTQAQNISADDINWTAVKAVNQADHSAFEYSCSFITHGNQSIDWSQNSGQLVTHYEVISVDGTWTKISRDGQVTYHVRNGNISGSITFARVDDQLSVHLQLAVDGVPDQDYTFSISSANKI